MKILVVSELWPTRKNPITGIFVRQQAEAYARAGCEVTVVAPYPVGRRSGGRPRAEQVAQETMSVYSPRHVRLPGRLEGGRWLFQAGVRDCARAIERVLRGRTYDVAHVHGVGHALFSMGAWGHHIEGPIVATLHGIDPLVRSRVNSDWYLQRLRSLWSEVEWVTIVGQPLRPYVRELGVPEEKIQVVHNGTSLPKVPVDSHQRTLSESRVVLSVSNLIPLKGIDLNLRALAWLAEHRPQLKWEYRIVGDGPKRVDLEALADRLGIRHRVDFLGRLSYGETMHQMAQCDVFSLPSWQEAFGIVYLEAMARARPVIACKDWGAGEVVEDGSEGILVTPKDIVELQEALESLLADPELAEQMGLVGLHTAQCFTWDANVQHYVRLFERTNAVGC